MQIEERFGWPMWRRKYRKRVGLVVGILLFFGILAFLGNFVWTIEVVGNETVSSDEILDFLEEEGLKIGSYKSALNPRELERKTLLELKELSWIAVNITGSTVTVEVNERILPLTCIWIMIRPVILLQGIPAKSIPWIFTTGKAISR